MTATDTAETFSGLLRSSTSGAHHDAERNPFMSALLRGELPLEGYTDMLAQHAYLYEVLEAPSETIAADPAVASLHDAALERTAALEADLVALVGENWREVHPANAGTEEYVARVREVGQNWAGGYAAHHYTRYLGDLSGGQVIGRIAAKTYGLTEGVNDNFARFEIEDLDAFKNQYRAALDAADWDRDEKLRVIDEIHNAYRLNGEVFNSLAEHMA